MGEHEGWAQPSGLLPNGLLPNEAAGVARVLDAERWLKAEERTAELIACIQPNPPSEELRNAVANYVQRLIMKCFSCQVFTFGSVPLKTYLPDGDIDLTAMSENENLKDTWASKVRDALENEERSENAEFCVKEVQYIQAEVKIVKCLVENIVVDISFNQVGGLCTLCFLEEIDHLINQNHLFKRSIILIKAWCYYESRILGAHHGLISTYALETLVLYIFHVFNNSFAGPLEVLYRFLEFFSNFDWESFCVSLWGPVPISSLPDMTAEPPRKDSGDLLLSKIFLHACSAVYAVLPVGQEGQVQPFVSKHFNVIDPLRSSNNLGRSVSKGNFFRIRSAFTFGVKRLARLLECPKENLITEVNQFFMNTWERHGSGHRPDAPIRNLHHSEPAKAIPVEESNNSRSIASNKKKNENPGSQAGYEDPAEGGLAFQGSSLQVHNAISQHSRNAYRTSNSSMASRSQSQRSHGVGINSRKSDQFERNIGSSGTIQADKGQKILPSDYSINDHEGQGRFQFARTQSSPELTEASAEVLSRGMHSRVVETGKKQNAPTRLDYSNRRNNIGSEVSGGHNARHFDDPSSLRQSSSHQSPEAGVDSNNVSNSYQDDTGFAMREEFASVSEALEIQQEMHQEEQDLVNMMASSTVQNFNGPVQLPMHLASPHLPLPFSPVLASMGYAQRHLSGVVPTNVSLIEPSWGSSMQYTQGFVSSPLSQYFPAAGLNLNPDDMVESGNESSGVSEVNPEDSDCGIWHEHDDGSARLFDPDNGGFQMLHSDEKQQTSMGTFNFVPSSRGSNSNASVMHSQHKFARENRGSVSEDYTDGVRYQSSRGNDVNSNDRNTSLRFSPVPHPSSSRSKPSSESSRDGSSTKFPKSVKDKWGAKLASSAVMTPLYGKTTNGWQFEGSSENVSAQEDDDGLDWVPLSTMSTDMVERVKGSASLSSMHARSHQLSGYEPAQISGPDPMIPISPLLVGSSRPRVVDNSGVVPFAFYPTGPPVPFLTMLPFCNFPSGTRNSDGSRSQHDKEEREDNARITPADQNFDSTESLDQTDARMSSTASINAASEASDELKADILNSDFASHWQNLQYGRFCQNTRAHGPMIYPSPVMVPPVYLQGQFSWDGSGRPLSSNPITQIMGYGPRLVPVMPLRPGPNRPSGVFPRYGDEAPRYRGGTGTYLPNPKVSFRERPFSSTRNHRGNYNYDRSEHSDREGSWISSKARAAGRSHGRNQAEKPNSRLDRSTATENRADRSWDSYRREPVASHEAQNSSFGSSNSTQGSANMAYGMYPLTAVSPNGVNPAGHAVSSVVMLYPYDQGVGYGSSAEPLEFGSLGHARLSGTSEVPRSSDGNPLRGVYEQRHGSCQGGSPRTSPDQPSSPRVKR